MTDEPVPSASATDAVTAAVDASLSQLSPDEVEGDLRGMPVTRDPVGEWSDEFLNALGGWDEGDIARPSCDPPRDPLPVFRARLLCTLGSFRARHSRPAPARVNPGPLSLSAPGSFPSRPRCAPGVVAVAPVLPSRGVSTETCRTCWLVGAHRPACPHALSMTNAFDPAFALANLRTAHEGISSLLSDKLLPEIARAPLQRAVQGIREATGAVVLEGGVHLSELAGLDGDR